MSESKQPLIVSPAAMRRLAIAASPVNDSYDGEPGKHGRLPPPSPVPSAGSTGGSYADGGWGNGLDEMQQPGDFPCTWLALL